jgi:rod shape-determining protein MreD
VKGKAVLYLLAAPLALAMSATLNPRIAIGDAKPDLTVGLVVYAALLEGALFGTGYGFYVGFLKDMVSPTPLGLNALALCMTGYLVGHIWDSVVKESHVTQGATLLVAGLLHDILYFLVYSRGDLELFGIFLLRVALPSALYTAVVCPVLLRIGEGALRRKVTFHGRKILLRHR